jgi:NADPH:quinone reductase-like Zn-dependent oxidoreductase
MSLLMWWKPFASDDVATIVRMVASGEIAPRIDRTFRLAEVVDALRYVDSGASVGKVLVVP